MALLKAVQEVMFVIKSLKSIKISVKLLIIVRVNDVGAIFMADSATATSHLNHIHIKYKYVNEYVEDRIVKITFIMSAENVSSILTKNLCGDSN